MTQDPAVLEGIGSLVLFCEDPPANEDHWTVEETRNIMTLPAYVRADKGLTKMNRLSRRTLRFKYGTSAYVDSEVYVYARVAEGKRHV